MAELILTTGSGYPLKIIVQRPDGTLYTLQTAVVTVWLRRLPTPADPAGELVGPLPAVITDAEAARVQVDVGSEVFAQHGLWTVTPEVSIPGQPPQRGLPVAFVVRQAP